MAIVRYRPTSVWSMFDELNKALRTDDLLRMDVKDEKDKFIVIADLPGVKKEDIKISVKDNVLTVQAERNVESKEQNENYVQVERVAGKYFRQLALPTNIDPGKITASLKDGVLELMIPKVEQSQPRWIDIEEKK